MKSLKIKLAMLATATTVCLLTQSLLAYSLTLYNNSPRPVELCYIKSEILVGDYTKRIVVGKRILSLSPGSSIPNDELCRGSKILRPYERVEQQIRVESGFLTEIPGMGLATELSGILVWKGGMPEGLLYSIIRKVFDAIKQNRTLILDVAHMRFMSDIAKEFHFQYGRSRQATPYAYTIMAPPSLAVGQFKNILSEKNGLGIDSRIRIFDNNNKELSDVQTLIDGMKVVLPRAPEVLWKPQNENITVK